MVTPSLPHVSEIHHRRIGKSANFAHDLRGARLFALRHRDALHRCVKAISTITEKRAGCEHTPTNFGEYFADCPCMFERRLLVIEPGEVTLGFALDIDSPWVSLERRP